MHIVNNFIFCDDGGIRKVIDIAIAHLREMVFGGRVGLMDDR